MLERGLLIRGGRIVDPSQGLDECADLLILNGQVARIYAHGETADGLAVPVFDATGLVVSPGFVDIHCHLREPGYEYKETIATGTAAAARGGFTTVCCMANTNPVVDSRGIVEYIQRKAVAEGVVRVLSLGAVTKGLAGKELAEMGDLADAGAVAFSDDGNPVANSGLMRHALEYSRMFGRPIVEHCEDPDLAAGGCANEGPTATRLGLKGIPAAAE